MDCVCAGLPLLSEDRPDLMEAMMPQVPPSLWSALQDTVDVQALTSPGGVRDGKTFKTWFNTCLSQQKKAVQQGEKVLIMFTPESYGAIDFYVVLCGSSKPHVIGCQTKIWCETDKGQVLEKARQAALTGQAAESRWQPLVKSDYFVAYTGAEAQANDKFIVTKATMWKYFSRSILRACLMSD
eukprot:6467679-Amphidinium_carterae.3